jgi:hypothetical protein
MINVDYVIDVNSRCHYDVMMSCYEQHAEESTKSSGEEAHYISQDQHNAETPSGSNSQQINDLDQSVQNQKSQKGKRITWMMSCYEQHAEETTKNLRRESTLQKRDQD